MGNIADKDGADVEDGEVMYETIARDITYRRCSDPEDSRRGDYAEKNSGPRPQRSVSRAKSMRRAISENNFQLERRSKPFMLSDMEVQVDGSKAKLVPRKSVLKRKGVSTLRSRLIVLKKRRQEKRNKIEKSTDAVTKENIPFPAGFNFAKRPSYDEAISTVTKKQDNNLSQSPKFSQSNRADIILMRPDFVISRPNSLYMNSNNNNESRRNSEPEKDKLQKTSSSDALQDIYHKMGQLSIVSQSTKF